MRKTPAAPERPVTLRGYRGGPLRGTIVYAASDFSVAERYASEISTLEYRAQRPLFVDSAEEAQRIQAAAFADSRFLGGRTGHDHLGEWARAQGYDALILSAQARASLDVDGFVELLFLDPERVRELDHYTVSPAMQGRPSLLPLPEPPAPIAVGQAPVDLFDELL